MLMRSLPKSLSLHHTVASPQLHLKIEALGALISTELNPSMNPKILQDRKRNRNITRKKDELLDEQKKVR